MRADLVRTDVGKYFAKQCIINKWNINPNQRQNQQQKMCINSNYIIGSLQVKWQDGMPALNQHATSQMGGPSDSTQGPEMPPLEALGLQLHV
jgi:hypothetical protein